MTKKNLVLRRQHDCILLLPDLSGRRLLASIRALLPFTLGFELANWLFAIPAVYTIDTFGRRNLLLTNFPLMSLCMFSIGFQLLDSKGDHAHRQSHLHLPWHIPLRYCLFAWRGPRPIHLLRRSLSAMCSYVWYVSCHLYDWIFNFTLSITWPSLQAAVTIQGASSWYVAWNIISLFLVLLSMPETKRQDSRRIGSIVLCAYVSSCRIWLEADPLLLPKLPTPAACGAGTPV